MGNDVWPLSPTEEPDTAPVPELRITHQQIDSRWIILRSFMTPSPTTTTTPDDGITSDEENEQKSPYKREALYRRTFLSLSPNGQTLFAQFGRSSTLYCFHVSESNLELVRECCVEHCLCPHLSWTANNHVVLVSKGNEYGLDEAKYEQRLLRKSVLDRNRFVQIYRRVVYNDHFVQIREIECGQHSELSSSFGCGDTKMYSCYSSRVLALYFMSTKITHFLPIACGAAPFTLMSLDVENVDEFDLTNLIADVKDLTLIKCCYNMQWILLPNIIYEYSVFPNANGRLTENSIRFQEVRLYTMPKKGHESRPVFLANIQNLVVQEETPKSCHVAYIYRDKGVDESWLIVGRIVKRPRRLSEVMIPEAYIDVFFQL